jgi:hypothetical protein
MTVREQPNYTLSSLTAVPYEQLGIDFDFPIDALHESITPMNEGLKKWKLEVLQVPTIEFPLERQRMLRRSRFNLLTEKQKLAYLAAMEIDPQINAKQYKLIKHYMKPPQTLVESKACYWLMTHLIDMGGTSFKDECDQFVSDAFGMVAPAIIDSENPLYDVCRNPSLVTELVSSITSAIMKIQSIKKSMHLRRHMKKMSPLPEVIDSYSAQQFAMHCSFLRSKAFTLTISYMSQRGDITDIGAAQQWLQPWLDKDFEEIEKLEERAYDSDGDFYTQTKDIIAYEKKLSDVARSMKKALGLKKVEATISLYRASGGYEYLVTRDYVVYGMRNVISCVLTEHELYEAEVLLAEFAATITSICAHVGRKEAELYRETMIRTWEWAKTASYDTSNYLTAFQRSYESSKSSVGEFSAGKKFDFREHGEYEYVCSIWDRYISKMPIDPVASAKSLRTLRQFAFEPVCLFNEHYRCFTIPKTPPDSEIEVLRAGIKYLIYRFHYIVLGESIPTIEEALADANPLIAESVRQGAFHGIDYFKGLNLAKYGAKAYTEDIELVKDSASVPNDSGIYKQAGYFQSLPATERREVLYWGRRDIKGELQAFKASIRENIDTPFPIRLFAKPEQKEGSRTITMECAPVRAGNSVIQTNALPISKCFWGSLMGKSGAQKLNSMQQALSYAHDARSSGLVTLLIKTDFKKFGHSVDWKIDNMIAEELSLYWDQPWVKDFLKTIANSVISAQYHGAEVCFKNAKMADGQGMRNAMWEMLLEAVPFACFAEIYKALPELSKSYPIAPVFFMDDHILVLCFKGDPLLSPAEAGERFFKKALPVIEGVYNRFELQIEREKTSGSVLGFQLLGDIYTSMGIVVTPSKGASSSFRPSKMNAPSVSNLINDVNSSVMSAVNTGLRPETAWSISLFGLFHKLICFAPRLVQSYAHVLVPLLFSPQEHGGFGFPLPQHINIGMGFMKDIDLLYMQYENIAKETKFGRMFASLLAQVNDIQPKKGRFLKVIAHNPLSTPLIVDLMSKAYGQSLGIDISYMLMDRDDKINRIMDSMAVIPPTLRLFLQDLHPVSELLAKIEKISESATARELASKGEVYRCQMAEKSRFAAHLKLMAVKLAIPGQAPTDFQEYINAMKEPSSHLPARTPSKFFALPINAGSKMSHHYVEFHKLSNPQPPNFRIGKKPGPSVVNISPLPSTGVFGRLAKMHEAIYAHMSEYQEDARFLSAALSMLADAKYRPIDFHPQGAPVVYRDVQGLSYTPSITASWVGKENTEYSLFHTDVGEITLKNGQHYNYNMTLLAAYLSRRLSDTFIMGSGPMWKSPEIKNIPGTPAFEPPARGSVPDRIYDAVRAVTEKKLETVISMQSFDKMKHSYKESARITLETSRLLNELKAKYREEGKKAEEDVFDDAIAVKDSYIPETYDLTYLIEITRLSPKMASKALWDAWVGECYQELRRRNINVYAELQSLPQHFNSYNAIQPQAVAALKSITPSENMLNRLSTIAQQIGVYDELLTWHRLVWLSVMRVPVPPQLSNLKTSVVQMVSKCPSIYVKTLRRKITGFQIDNNVFGDDERRKNFLLAWADRYRYNMQTNQADMMALINANKKDKRSSQRGEFVSDYHRIAYIRQHEYKLLASTYYALGEFKMDISNKSDFHAVVSIAASNAFLQLLKEQIGEEKSVTIAEFVVALEASPKQGKAQAVKRSLERLEECMRLVCMDMGAKWDYTHDLVELCAADKQGKILSFLKSRGTANIRKLDDLIVEYLGSKDTVLSDAVLETVVKKKSKQELYEISMAMANAQAKRERRDLRATKMALLRGKVKGEPPDESKERKWRARVERDEMYAAEAARRSAMHPSDDEDEYVKEISSTNVKITKEDVDEMRRSEMARRGGNELEKYKILHKEKERERERPDEDYVESTSSEEEVDTEQYDEELATAKAIEESQKAARLRQEAEVKAKMEEDRLLAEAIARAEAEREEMAKKEETDSEEEWDLTPVKKKVAPTETKEEAEKPQIAQTGTQETLREAEQVGYQAEKKTEDSDDEWDLSAPKKVARIPDVDYVDEDD